MKIYKYYLDGSLYAYTDEKKYTKQFELTRNMKLFKKVVHIYDTKEDLDADMCSLPANNKLIEDVLSDGGNNGYSVICTIKESARLDDITSTLYHIETTACEIGINYEEYQSVCKNSAYEKYLKRVQKLLRKILPNNACPDVNTLALFYSLNKSTFVTNEEGERKTKYEKY